MWKLIQMIINIFNWILERCPRCFRRTNDENEQLLDPDVEAPGHPEDTGNDYLKCKTKVGPYRTVDSRFVL